MAVRDEISEELMRDYKNPEDLLGENGIIKPLYKGLLGKAMPGELDVSPGLLPEKHERNKRF